LPENHPLQKFITISTDEFRKQDDDEAVKVNLLWGATGLTSKSLNKYATDIVTSAELKWDKDFSMFEHQEFIVDVCEEAIGDGFLTRNGEVKCFMRDFKSWLLSNRSKFVRWYANPSANTTDRPVAFPVATETDFLFFLSHWSARALKCS
jgi:hypothetical protein